MKKMTKEEVQKRVLKGGEPLNLDLFSWDENTRTFSSNESGLVLDFSGVYNCTFKTGSDCTFDTGSNCIFKTGSYCTFKTYSDCTFNTSYSCTFNTGSCCIFNTGSKCVILRRDTFEIIQPTEGQTIQLCTLNVKGYLFKENNKLYYSEDKENEYIIVDSILSRVIYRKGNVLKVVNYNEDKESYIIKDGDLYSHGKTIKEARDSLGYKISSRDTSMYKDLTLDSILSKDECIKMYRVITGACENGTKYFVSKQEPSKIKDNYSIKELIELTKGQYGNLELKKYFKF